MLAQKRLSSVIGKFSMEQKMGALNTTRISQEALAGRGNSLRAFRCKEKNPKIKAFVTAGLNHGKNGKI